MYVCTIMLQRSHLQEVITMGLEMGTAEGNTHNKMNISYLTTSSKKKKSFGSTDLFIILYTAGNPS